MEASKIPEVVFGEPDTNTELTSVAHGEQMRKKMEVYFGRVEAILCDFTGVETVSLTFVEECFGKLFDARKDGDSYTGIQYWNTKDEIKQRIAGVVMKKSKLITRP
jgi:hypothetical protein